MNSPLKFQEPEHKYKRLSGPFALYFLLSAFCFLLAYQLSFAEQPDLTIESISLSSLSSLSASNSSPIEGETVILTAKVANLGAQTQDDIEVRFFEDSPDELGLQIEKGKIIIGLKSQERSEAEVRWRAKAKATKIYVLVDAGNLISESNEQNNLGELVIVGKALTLPRPKADEIKAAVRRGLDWLRSQQGDFYVICPKDGHYNPKFVKFCMVCRQPLEGLPVEKSEDENTKGGWNPILGPGSTALALLTFLSSGVAESDPTVQSGLDYLLHHTPVPNWEEWSDAYDFAAGVLALTATNNKGKDAYFNQVKYAVERLIRSQTKDGGWGYGHAPDMAHLHYVILALYAAKGWGLEIPQKVWQKAADWIKSVQRKDGGWSYAGLDVGSPWAESSYGSMTATAIMGLRICGVPMADPSLKGGLDWLKAHYTISSNPGAYEWHYYYLLALQRALDIPPRIKTMDDHNWYEEAASLLLSTQEADGSWKGSDQEDSITATAFVILFLHRAITH